MLPRLRPWVSNLDMDDSLEIICDMFKARVMVLVYISIAVFTTRDGIDMVWVNDLKREASLDVSVLTVRVWVRVLKRDASLDVSVLTVRVWVNVLKAVLIADTTVFDVRVWVNDLKMEASLDNSSVKLTA